MTARNFVFSYLLPHLVPKEKMFQPIEGLLKKSKFGYSAQLVDEQLAYFLNVAKEVVCKHAGYYVWFIPIAFPYLAFSLPCNEHFQMLLKFYNEEFLLEPPRMHLTFPNSKSKKVNIVKLLNKGPFLFLKMAGVVGQDKKEAKKEEKGEEEKEEKEEKEEEDDTDDDEKAVAHWNAEAFAAEQKKDDEKEEKEESGSEKEDENEEKSDEEHEAAEKPAKEIEIVEFPDEDASD